MSRYFDRRSTFPKSVTTTIFSTLYGVVILSQYIFVFLLSFVVRQSLSRQLEKFSRGVSPLQQNYSTHKQFEVRASNTFKPPQSFRQFVFYVSYHTDQTSKVDWQPSPTLVTSDDSYLLHAPLLIATVCVYTYRAR